MVIGSTLAICLIAAALSTICRYVAQKIGWPDWATWFVGVLVALFVALASPIVITIK